MDAHRDGRPVVIQLHGVAQIEAENQWAGYNSPSSKMGPRFSDGQWGADLLAVFATVVQPTSSSHADLLHLVCRN